MRPYADLGAAGNISRSDATMEMMAIQPLWSKGVWAQPDEPETRESELKLTSGNWDGGGADSTSTSRAVSSESFSHHQPRSSFLLAFQVASADPCDSSLTLQTITYLVKQLHNLHDDGHFIVEHIPRVPSHM